MGLYLNPGSDNFQMGLNSEIYVDKSALIAKLNPLIRTKQRFVCVSRPRRFGKTMAAEMLAAYYSVGEDTKKYFEGLAVTAHPTFETHLNQYNCLMINIQDFIGVSGTVENMIKKLSSAVTLELQQAYPEIQFTDTGDFLKVMFEAYHATKRPFIILIDEWDCIFRLYKEDAKAQKDYLDFLRIWLKDKAYIALAYMTGILTIKKYGAHSALNMFREYSISKPGKFLKDFGFTHEEVEAISKNYMLDLEEVKAWYNGYFTDLGEAIYNPTSVVFCFESEQIDNYWNQTETYEALKIYIRLNYDYLRDKIVRLLTGESIPVNIETFSNDMTTFRRSDDVLTLLIHLGYLSYNFKEKTTRIPNEEVKQVFVDSIKSLKWDGVVKAIDESDALLKSLWNQDEEAVAKGIGNVHEQNSSILKYNDENALSCAISLALYTANEYYTVIREFPTGKGYADLVYLPRKKHLNKPVIVVELKWDKSATGAIEQIKTRNYLSALADYRGNLLLVGINYNKEDKIHHFRIESYSL